MKFLWLYLSEILKHLHVFPIPQCWFGYYNHLSAPIYAWLKMGEGEGHNWAENKGVNSKTIQEKHFLFQGFLTSIVDRHLIKYLSFLLLNPTCLPQLGIQGKFYFDCFFHTLQSSEVKRTPQDFINEFIIRKLNPLVLVDFSFISVFLHA